jgi:hypothetical protein
MKKLVLLTTFFFASYNFKIIAIAEKNIFKKSNLLSIENGCRSIDDVAEANKKIANLKRKLKRAKQKNIGKIKRQLRLANNELNSLKKLDECIYDPSGPIPTPTGTPVAIPTTAGSLYFDTSGNVTDTGKLFFEIPNNLTANIAKGKIWYNNNCVGCHVEKNNRSFIVLRESTVKPPMSFNAENLPDSDLANVTAYLNRYRY